jgi:RNase P subunit RPR2
VAEKDRESKRADYEGVIDDNMALKNKLIPIRCPGCEQLIYYLSFELLKQAEDITIVCSFCGHIEHYEYENGGIVITSSGNM